MKVLVIPEALRNAIMVAQQLELDGEKQMRAQREERSKLIRDFLKDNGAKPGDHYQMDENLTAIAVGKGGEYHTF